MHSAITWSDVDWLRSVVKGKLLLKGILHPADNASLGEATAPVLFNTWKHHANALRLRIRQAAEGGAAALDGLAREMVVIGTELMDLYTGSLTPRAIGEKVISHLAAELHLALDALPQFRGLTPAALRGRLLVAPSPDYIERAFNHAKYGEFSAAPMLEITVPTLADPGLAPPGKQVLSAIVQYAPYALAAGWQGQRQRFTDLVIDTIAGFAPDLRRCVTSAELLTPPDIEREFRISGGHWHHAELAFDQFFMVRPLPGAAQYQAPLAGLYLCGAGCHPGGGVMGIAGRNAARQVMREAA